MPKGIITKPKDPEKGIAQSNEPTTVARELTMPAASMRYRKLAQVGVNSEHGYRLHMPVTTWIPLSNERPTQIGFPQNSDFYLTVPKREVIDPETEMTVPWFLNRDRYMPIFPEATKKIAALCNARPAPTMAHALNGQPAIGVLPGFFYEAEKSLGFRVNPQSFYASHILFFMTGYTYNRELVGLAQIATESSVWMKIALDDGKEMITMLALSVYQLVKALNFKNSLDLLNELFITPFNFTYGGAEKLVTPRAEDALRAGQNRLDAATLAEFQRTVEEFNSASQIYWKCFVMPNPRSDLSRNLLTAPTFTLGDRVLVYRFQGRDKMLRISRHNMYIVRKMASTVNRALKIEHSPKEREQIYFQIFATHDGLEEYGRPTTTEILLNTAEDD